MSKNSSPWLYDLVSTREKKVLSGAVYTDIAIIGGGISGVCTAYFVLKYSDKKVVLVEGNLLAHGATGHNAGYIVPDFEKPYKDIVKEYGVHNARSGLMELHAGVELYRNICEEIGLPVPEIKTSVVVFSTFEHLLSELHEEFLKFTTIKKEVFVRDDTDWLDKLPDNFKAYINIISAEEFKRKIGSAAGDIEKYYAFYNEKIMVGNSAVFTETLATYLIKKYETRFTIYEESFVHSVRLLQNNRCIIDSQRGVCFSDKIVLCTNGFENFDIYGPYGLQIDKEFHHTVSGLIGYMTGTFIKGKVSDDVGGVFYEESYNHTNMPLDAGPYIYYTSRKFKIGADNGELFCVGGPEIKLHDRRIYKRDHEADQNIYTELKDFQKKFFGIQEEPQFKWHGLMGYTKTGIRIVGQDKRFLDLFYNLGCNGIGVIPSVAGGLRIAKILNGEKLEKSIFDPQY